LREGRAFATVFFGRAGRFERAETQSTRRAGEKELPLGLLDGDAGPKPGRIPRYLGMGAAALLAVAALLFISLRFHTEKATVNRFFAQVTAGDFHSAYRTWKPSSSYAFADFMGDWGPNGEYGPVKSFELRSAQRPAQASGVVVTVTLSAYAPFPGENDPKSRTNKEVRLWIESSDQSISYAPTDLRIRR
jgi:hypothetical protein